MGLRADWMASETRAWRALRRAVAARDHAALRPGARHAGPRAFPDRTRAATRALATPSTALGAARYGEFRAATRTRAGDSSAGYLTDLRKAARAKTPVAALPPLNPGI